MWAVTAKASGAVCRAEATDGARKVAVSSSRAMHPSRHRQAARRKTMARASLTTGGP